MSKYGLCECVRVFLSVYLEQLLERYCVTRALARHHTRLIRARTLTHKPIQSYILWTCVAHVRGIELSRAMAHAECKETGMDFPNQGLWRSRGMAHKTRARTALVGQVYSNDAFM